MTKKVLLIYHSQSGLNKKLADACLEGCKKENVEVVFKNAKETILEDVTECSGIIIVSPEYFGYMAGAMKDFFDRTYYPARDLSVNLPYALIIGCENDGRGAERSIETIAKGYVLKKVLDNLIVKKENINHGLSKANEMGQTFSAGIDLGIF